MKRAWNACLVLDWKVGEALGGVLRRGITLWLAFFVAALIQSSFDEAIWELIVEAVGTAALIIWIYQPQRLYRNKKYSGWSVPCPT